MTHLESIIIAVLIFLLVVWIAYVMRLLHKTRDQLAQAFDAINSLLSDDLKKTEEKNQSPLGRLHQYKGYVIKIISAEGGFGGIIYDNSMKKIINTTAVLPASAAVLMAAKVLIDFLDTPTDVIYGASKSKNDD